MEIVFLILKIIGICLLIFLGICLLLIGSVIFIPVRYRIKGEGEVPKELKTDAVFSWFLHIIHARIHYTSDGFQFSIRILGIPLHLGKEKKPKKKKIKKSKQPTDNRNQNKNSATNNIQQKAETYEIKEKSGVQKETEIYDKIEESDDIQKDTEKKKMIKEKSGVQSEADIVEETVQPKKKKNTWWSRLSISKIKEHCKRFWEKLKHIKNQFTDIKSIISEETNRNAVTALFQELKYLMKHYAPRKASGELLFGTDDPATTGEILGIISLIPFWYRYKISVIPDFTTEELYAKGHISVKGHMRNVHILLSGIRLIKNKDIRKLFNQIRR